MSSVQFGGTNFVNDSHSRLPTNDLSQSPSSPLSPMPLTTTYPDGFEPIFTLYDEGMSLVVVARRESDDVEVVLKTARTGDASCDPTEREEIYRRNRSALKGEANAMKSIQKSMMHTPHEHILRLHNDHISIDGAQWLELEYVRGGSLRAMEGAENKCSLEELLDIGIQTLDALCCIHINNIYHRDIKPANILFEGRDDNLRVKIADFGIAKFASATNRTTASKNAPGTAGYMAPEVRDGVRRDECEVYRISPRSDVYSLGCTLAAIACGASPNHSGEPFTKERLRNNGALRVTSNCDGTLPDSIATIIHSCFNKEYTKRLEPEGLLLQLEAAKDALARGNIRSFIPPATDVQMDVSSLTASLSARMEASLRSENHHSAAWKPMEFNVGDSDAQQISPSSLCDELRCLYKKRFPNIGSYTSDTLPTTALLPTTLLRTSGGSHKTVDGDDLIGFLANEEQNSFTFFVEGRLGAGKSVFLQHAARTQLHDTPCILLSLKRIAEALSKVAKNPHNPESSRTSSKILTAKQLLMISLLGESWENPQQVAVPPESIVVLVEQLWGCSQVWWLLDDLDACSEENTALLEKTRIFADKCSFQMLDDERGSHNRDDRVIIATREFDPTLQERRNNKTASALQRWSVQLWPPTLIRRFIIDFFEHTDAHKAGVLCGARGMKTRTNHEIAHRNRAGKEVITQCESPFLKMMELPLICGFVCSLTFRTMLTPSALEDVLRNTVCMYRRVTTYIYRISSASQGSSRPAVADLLRASNLLPCFDDALLHLAGRYAWECACGGDYAFLPKMPPKGRRGMKATTNGDAHQNDAALLSNGDIDQQIVKFRFCGLVRRVNTSSDVDNPRYNKLEFLHHSFTEYFAAEHYALDPSDLHSGRQRPLKRVQWGKTTSVVMRIREDSFTHTFRKVTFKLDIGNSSILCPNQSSLVQLITKVLVHTEKSQTTPYSDFFNAVEFSLRHRLKTVLRNPLINPSPLSSASSGFVFNEAIRDHWRRVSTLHPVAKNASNAAHNFLLGAASSVTPTESCRLIDQFCAWCDLTTIIDVASCFHSFTIPNQHIPSKKPSDKSEHEFLLSIRPRLKNRFLDSLFHRQGSLSDNVHKYTIVLAHWMLETCAKKDKLVTYLYLFDKIGDIDNQALSRLRSDHVLEKHIFVALQHGAHHTAEYLRSFRESEPPLVNLAVHLGLNIPVSKFICPTDVAETAAFRSFESVETFSIDAQQFGSLLRIAVLESQDPLRIVPVFEEALANKSDTDFVNCVSASLNAIFIPGVDAASPMDTALCVPFSVPFSAASLPLLNIPIEEVIESISLSELEVVDVFKRILQQKVSTSTPTSDDIAQTLLAILGNTPDGPVSELISTMLPAGIEKAVMVVSSPVSRLFSELLKDSTLTLRHLQLSCSDTREYPCRMFSETILRFEHLTHLVCDGLSSDVSDLVVRGWCSKLVCLRHLAIPRCRRVSHRGLSDLYKLASTMVHLDLSRCTGIVKADGVSKLTSLRTLKLDGCVNLSHTCVEHLPSTIEDLHLANNYWMVISAVDKLEKNFEHLRTLDVSGTDKIPKEQLAKHSIRQRLVTFAF